MRFASLQNYSLKAHSESPHFVLYCLLRRHFPHALCVPASQELKNRRAIPLHASMHGIALLFFPRIVTSSTRLNLPGFRCRLRSRRANIDSLRYDMEIRVYHRRQARTAIFRSGLYPDILQTGPDSRKS